MSPCKPWNLPKRGAPTVVTNSRSQLLGGQCIAAKCNDDLELNTTFSQRRGLLYNNLTIVFKCVLSGGLAVLSSICRRNLGASQKCICFMGSAVHSTHSRIFVRTIQISIVHFILHLIPVSNNKEYNQADVHAGIRYIDPCPNSRESTSPDQSKVVCDRDRKSPEAEYVDASNGPLQSQSCCHPIQKAKDGNYKVEETGL